MQAIVCDHCKKPTDRASVVLMTKGPGGTTMDLCGWDCLAKYAIEKGGKPNGTLINKAAKWIGVE